MAKKKKCVAIYVLMSAASHEGGKSLEAQMAECTAFLMSLGYSVDDACVYREVGKAASLDRPQLAELLGLAVAGELEALVVCGADRLARDESQLQVFWVRSPTTAWTYTWCAASWMPRSTVMWCGQCSMIGSVWSAPECGNGRCEERIWQLVPVGCRPECRTHPMVMTTTGWLISWL